MYLHKCCSVTAQHDLEGNGYDTILHKNIVIRYDTVPNTPPYSITVCCYSAVLFWIFINQFGFGSICGINRGFGSVLPF